MKKYVITVSVWFVAVWLIFFAGFLAGGWKSRATIDRQKFMIDVATDMAAQAIIGHGAWQATAEHYGGICKWLIEEKPIYEDVDTGYMANCLVILGGDINVNKPNALITNCEFRMWDMDWVRSLEAVDPNEFERIEL